MLYKVALRTHELMIQYDKKWLIISESLQKKPNTLSNFEKDLAYCLSVSSKDLHKHCITLIFFYKQLVYKQQGFKSGVG